MDKYYNIVILDYASGAIILDTVPDKFCNDVEKWLYEEQDYRESDISYMFSERLKLIQNT